MTALLAVLVPLIALAAFGVATGTQVRQTRDAFPDRTDYQALFLADQRRTQ